MPTHYCNINCQRICYSGPAYKGIPLVSSAAIALAARGHNLPYAFNRKEAKDHGEGGVFVGAPINGNVVLIDDVITAGTAIRESVTLIQAAGARVSGIVVLFDRQERMNDASLSATQQLSQQLQVPVCALASFADILAMIEGKAEYAAHVEKMREYWTKFGVL